MHYSDYILGTLLYLADAEERLALTQALAASPKVQAPDKARTSAPQAPAVTEPLPALQLLRQIRLAGGHGLMNALRGSGIAYGEMLRDACVTLGVKDAPWYYASNTTELSVRDADACWSKLPAEEASQCADYVTNYVETAHRALLAQLAVNIYEGLAPAKRAQVDRQLQHLAQSNGLGGVAKGAALLAIGNAGGFATYTLMSTVLSAATFGAAGFGAYTFASSMLSVALGPVGWLLLGGWAVTKLGAPDKAKAVRLVSTTALLAERLGSGIKKP